MMKRFFSPVLIVVFHAATFIKNLINYLFRCTTPTKILISNNSKRLQAILTIQSLNSTNKYTRTRWSNSSNMT